MSALLDAVLDPVRAEDCRKSGELQAMRSEYAALLKAADWAYDFSDDAAVWCKGRDQFRRIRKLAPLVDPDGALFNAARPAGHGIPTL